MALVINDRVKESTTTTGTGTVTLGGAVQGFETFAAGIGNSNTTYYCIQLNTEFEVGLGTLAGDSSTLARTTVISSSNSDSAVNFSSGTKFVFCCLPASKATVLDASNNLTLPGTLDVDGGITVDNITIDGTEIDLSSGDLTVDVAGDIILDTGGQDVILRRAGTAVGGFTSLASSDLVMTTAVSDKDIIFKGLDDSSIITALTLDMSDAGAAAFNSEVTATGFTGTLDGVLGSGTPAAATVSSFIMPDVTSGKILVADGTSYEEVAVSGDVTIASSGAITIANNAVETAMINADAVTGAKIADNAINSEHYTDGSIDTAHIANDQITNALMADDAIGADQLAANAVVNASVASDAAIVDTKLATISTANKVDIGALDIDGASDIGADLVDADLIIVDDGANGTEKKSAMSRVKTYIADVTLTTAAQTNITSLGTLTGLTVSGIVTANAKLDLNGTELILDADADTSITADTDDQIDFRIGGADVMEMNATAFSGGAIYENADDIAANYSITAGKNAFSVGPITIASGVTVTVPSGQRWVIL